MLDVNYFCHSNSTLLQNGAANLFNLLYSVLPATPSQASQANYAVDWTYLSIHLFIQSGLNMSLSSR